jgi:hypothetical protein
MATVNRFFRHFSKKTPDEPGLETRKEKGAQKAIETWAPKIQALSS